MPSAESRAWKRMVTMLAVAAVLSGCGDDDDPAPSEDTASQNVQGGTALPGAEPSVINNNVANPAAPQDPQGTSP